LRVFFFLAPAKKTKNDHARFFVARDGIGC
jgi:hypothetical protein